MKANSKRFISVWLATFRKQQKHKIPLTKEKRNNFNANLVEQNILLHGLKPNSKWKKELSIHIIYFYREQKNLFEVAKQETDMVNTKDGSCVWSQPDKFCKVA